MSDLRRDVTGIRSTRIAAAGGAFVIGGCLALVGFGTVLTQLRDGGPVITPATLIEAAVAGPFIVASIAAWRRHAVAALIVGIEASVCLLGLALVGAVIARYEPCCGSVGWVMILLVGFVLFAIARSAIRLWQWDRSRRDDLDGRTAAPVTARKA